MVVQRCRDGGDEVLSWCQGSAEVILQVQRYKGDAGCRGNCGGAEQVQRWCKGAGSVSEVLRFSRGDCAVDCMQQVQSRCKGAEVVQR